MPFRLSEEFQPLKLIGGIKVEVFSTVFQTAIDQDAKVSLQKE